MARFATKLTVTVALVRDHMGAIDYDATRNEFETNARKEFENKLFALSTKFSEHAESTSELNQRIAKAVFSVLAANPTAKHNRTAIVFGAVRALNPDMKDLPSVQTAVQNWLKDNTDRQGSDTGRLFVSVAGRDGGIFLRSDEQRDENTDEETGESVTQ